MTEPSRIRKQLYELTLCDLAKWPAWQFALDEEGIEGQDEATVRPIEEDPPYDPERGMMVVAATFRLADGSGADGYFYPQPGGTREPGLVSPVIIAGEAQVGFWYGLQEPDRVEIARAYRILGRPAGRVFPIECEPTVELTTGPARLTIPGFQRIGPHDSIVTFT